MQRPGGHVGGAVVSGFGRRSFPSRPPPASSGHCKRAATESESPNQISESPKKLPRSSTCHVSSAADNQPIDRRPVLALTAHVATQELLPRTTACCTRVYRQCGFALLRRFKLYDTD
eukprot:9501977-Pyramimonas_sp.AAC.1